ncbi:hypothetical protein EGW08_014767, partial [Elysia chlorotica]
NSGGQSGQVPREHDHVHEENSGHTIHGDGSPGERPEIGDQLTLQSHHIRSHDNSPFFRPSTASTTTTTATATTTTTTTTETRDNTTTAPRTSITSSTTTPSTPWSEDALEPHKTSTTTYSPPTTLPIRTTLPITTTLAAQTTLAPTQHPSVVNGSGDHVPGELPIASNGSLTTPSTSSQNEQDVIFEPPGMPRTLVELKFSMTWPEFCDSLVQIKDDLFRATKAGNLGQLTMMSQIHLDNVGVNGCVEPVNSTGQILVRMYLVNQTNHYSRVLTLSCAEILRRREELLKICSILREKLTEVGLYTEPFTPSDQGGNPSRGSASGQEPSEPQEQKGDDDIEEKT